MSEPVVIFAADSIFAHEAVETLARLDIPIAAGVLTGEPEWNLVGLANIIDESEVTGALTNMPAIVPVLVPGARKERVDQATKAGFGAIVPLLDPTALIAESASIAHGVYINTGAVIAAGVRIEAHALVNRAASIGHHCVIEDYATIGPGVTIASRCHIGAGAMICAGATLVPEIKIGANAVVAAGAAVFKDVKANTLVLGNPARLSKSNIKGYGNRGV